MFRTYLSFTHHHAKNWSSSLEEIHFLFQHAAITIDTICLSTGLKFPRFGRHPLNGIGISELYDLVDLGTVFIKVQSPGKLYDERITIFVLEVWFAGDSCPPSLGIDDQVFGNSITTDSGAPSAFKSEAGSSWRVHSGVTSRLMMDVSFCTLPSS